MNEEDKIILFGRYSADALNNENLFLYADGELIEERTPIGGRERDYFDETWDEVNPPIHLKDKRLADEIAKLIDDNDQLLQHLSKYLHSQTTPLQNMKQKSIQIGKYEFMNSYGNSSTGEESFYEKDNYEYRILLTKIYTIIDKYVDWNLKKSAGVITNDLFILPEKEVENKFQAYSLKKEVILSPVVFKYYAGLMYWDTEITLYEDGTLTEDHPHSYKDNDQDVYIIYESLELAAQIKAMINGKTALLQSIPEDFFINLPYKPLYQTVKFSDFEFTADRLTFPLTDDTKLHGITPEQLYEFQRLFMDIVNIIDGYIGNNRIWDTNLYLNWILFDRAPLFNRLKNENLIEAMKKYSDRGIDSFTYIGKYPFDGTDIYECNMNDYEEGSCPGIMPYLKVYDYGRVKLVYGDEAQELKDYFALEKSILEGKDKGLEVEAIKSYIENEENMCEKRAMNLYIRTQIERYIRAGWNDREIAALLKRKVSEVKDLRGAL